MRIRAIRRTAVAGAATIALLSPAVAAAAPEEIQVYMDEMNRRGESGLDLHLNTVAKGRTQPDYAGEQASGGRWRITPEFSYGLTSNLELGAYLPLATIDRHGDAGVDGAKVRLKFLAPRPERQDWFWGLNFEIGKVARKLDINPWNAELKGILGLHRGPWTVATNLNIDWVVSGPDHAPVDFQIATKLGYAVSKDLSLGVESYNGLGSARTFGTFGRQDQQLFLVADRAIGRWDLNLGLGYGYGQPEDRWTVKAVIGVPIH